MQRTLSLGFCLLFLAATSLTSQAQLIWAVGLDDGGWPAGDGGGPNTSFVQENGAINDLPGLPESTEEPRGADNDYYFAGVYTTAIPSVVAAYMDYTPVGVVSANEEAAERAFAAADNDLRYHFNLPTTLRTNDQLTVTFDPNNLHTDGQADPRYGIEVYFNGVLVQTQLVIRPAGLNIAYTTPPFTLAKVNAQTGPGPDNIVSLRGINYNAEGGGNWMGIDYVQLAPASPPTSFPWAVGRDDDGWPAGDGGGANTSFVQENGAINPLPGSPVSTEVSRGADNDYYFAGGYNTVIAGNGTYTPVGVVSVNEEAAERAFAADDLDLRYHFNLPSTLRSTDLLAVTFDALNLDDPNAVNTDPRFGIEVYFNGVLVQTQIVIRPAQLGVDYTTPPFSLARVNARTGPGFDNIVSLRGISYNAEGGGNWMGIDYVQLNPVAPPPKFPWTVGIDDDAWPLTGDGGEANASFVQENGAINPLPGSPVSTEVSRGADNDYYFAGIYTNVIAGNGTYTPVGTVFVHEEAAERAFAGGDLDLRYHFNLPSTLQPTDLLSVTFDALNLDDPNAVNTDPRFGIEVYFNNVLVQTQILIRPAQLGIDYSTPQFTLARVNARTGPGFDNIVSLRGISYNAEGGGNWMGIDYVALNPSAPTTTFPWTIGRDDDAWPLTGDGGEANTSFVQENGGISPLPGSPRSTELPQGADNDYYLAGVYTNAIGSNIAAYGDYTPVGIVYVNEEAAERAFAAADLDLRYHFNLPTSLRPTDRLTVTWDPLNLDERAENTDPRFGVEVYFNSVLVQTQLVIRPPELNISYTSPPFTLASANAQVGPGADNIVSLRGISYNADGGGNWMGVDYIALNAVADTNEVLAFKAPVISGGRVTLDWTGTGNLEWAPTVLGTWTPITPAPAKPYTENVTVAQTRFYRLRRP